MNSFGFSWVACLRLKSWKVLYTPPIVQRDSSLLRILSTNFWIVSVFDFQNFPTLTSKLHWCFSPFLYQILFWITYLNNRWEGRPLHLLQLLPLNFHCLCHCQLGIRFRLRGGEGMRRRRIQGRSWSSMMNNWTFVLVLVVRLFEIEANVNVVGY